MRQLFSEPTRTNTEGITHRSNPHTFTLTSTTSPTSRTYLRLIAFVAIMAGGVTVRDVDVSFSPFHLSQSSTEAARSRETGSTSTFGHNARAAADLKPTYASGHRLRAR